MYCEYCKKSLTPPYIIMVMTVLHNYYYHLTCYHKVMHIEEDYP